MTGQRALRVNVDHVHDRALSSAQLRRCCLREEERRTQIRAHEVVPLLRRHAAERCGIKRRRIVDERVQSSERFDRCSYYSRQRVHIEQVGRYDRGRACTLTVQLIAQVFRFADRLVTMNADRGAVRVKAASDSGADAPSSPSDQHGAAGESLMHVRGVHVRYVRMI